MPKTVKVALFADDASLISSHHNKLVVEKELQRAVTAVADWSASKKMVLNADRLEMTFFSTNSHEANWQPTSNTRLHHNLLLKFLGVTLDSQSLLKAIQSGSANTTDLRRMLNKRAGKTSLLWIPGHHGIAGN